VTTSADDLAALNASDGRQRWKEQVAFPGDYSIAVAVEQSVVYVLIQQAQGGYVEALNAADGRLRWCMPAIRPVNPSEGGGAPQLAIDAGAVYVGDGLHGFITAFSASDGRQFWQTRAEGGILSLVVADGQVYASSADMSSEFATGHTFSAFDARDGKERWHMQADNGMFYRPAVADGVVYVGESGPNNQEFLYALNASNGSQRWQIEQQGQGALGFGTPVIVGGVIYVADGHNIYALDASNGSRRWSLQEETSYNLGPVVANGTLYAGSFDDPDSLGIVFAYNASDGSRRWQSAEFPRPAPAYGSPGVAALTAGPDPIIFLSAVNGVVYGSTFETSAALAASTGKMLWSVSARTLAVG
jgi:outer membrane protein assembly factor BamB